MRYEEMKPDDFYTRPDGKEMVLVTSWDQVPALESEQEARAFWETHTLADHLWSKKRRLSAAAERYLKDHPEARRASKIS